MDTSGDQSGSKINILTLIILNRLTSTHNAFESLVEQYPDITAYILEKLVAKEANAISLKLSIGEFVTDHFGLSSNPEIQEKITALVDMATSGNVTDLFPMLQLAFETLKIQPPAVFDAVKNDLIKMLHELTLD